MTAAEAKVNEFANKILDFIEQSEAQHADPKWILQGVKGYICGMSDGIEFAEEMREPDHSVQAKTDEPRPMVGDSVKLNLCKESIDNIAKTLNEAYPSANWSSDERSEISDFLDEQLGVPEARGGIEIL
jgi:hypothetical protein